MTADGCRLGFPVCGSGGDDDDDAERFWFSKVEGQRERRVEVG